MSADTESPSLSERAGGSRVMSAVYGLAIFLSAYLLFQVQPLTSKSILPWFGGTPSVWTTCMLFFQLLLFAGYAYAHLLSSHLPSKAQLIVHSVIVALALTAGVLPDAGWKPTGAENPTLRIVLILAASIGLPFFALSSTGPLLQHWFSRAQAGRSPYHLYSLSNLGSLLGLLLYPFLIETFLELPQQAVIWRAAFVAFAVCCGLCGLNFARRTSAGNVNPAAGTNSGEPPALKQKLLWFALAAVPSSMLLATTNQACLDVASIPFLWVLPLALYLLTFIIAFAGEQWYFRNTCAFLLPISLLAVIGVMFQAAGAPLDFQLLSYFSALFLTAMCCHGELARARPEPHYLTTFYLWMSAGGATGGLFVGIIAPNIFDLYLELHVGIVATLLLMAMIRAELEAHESWYHFYRTPGVFFLSLAIGCVILLTMQVRRELSSTVLTERNFYGVLRVTQYEDDDDDRHKVRNLMNGRILHGKQWFSDQLRRWPTTYYGRRSAVGVTMLGHAAGNRRHIGVVGLGAGTVAAYGRPQDRFTFYEINEDVVSISAGGAAISTIDGELVSPSTNEATTGYFTYLQDTPASTQVILGDARLAMERSMQQQFDVLVLDAFSSDAIPAHLLTKEAFDVYLRHMRDDGIVLVHISNRHFDLEPVIKAIQNEFGLTGGILTNHEPGDNDVDRNDYGVKGTIRATWVLLSRKDTSPVFRHVERFDCNEAVLWTDAYSNLFQVLHDGGGGWKKAKKAANRLLERIGIQNAR